MTKPSIAGVLNNIANQVRSGLGYIHKILGFRRGRYTHGFEKSGSGRGGSGGIDDTDAPKPIIWDIV